MNLEPGAEVSTRTVERYQKLFRDNDLAARVFDDVTTRLIQVLDLDVSRQRLDSTHVFSHMASFGRTKLMAVAIKRFLTQLKRHDPERTPRCPKILRRRYEPQSGPALRRRQGRRGPRRCRQQTAEDLRCVIDRFADRPDLANRSSYKALVTIFDQQCELTRRQGRRQGQDRRRLRPEPVRPRRHLRRPQRPGLPGPDRRDLRAGERGAADHRRVAADRLRVRTRTAVLPMLDQLEKAGRLPDELLADTLYTSDENIQVAEARGVDLVGPVPGRAPESAPEALTVDDFAWDERTGTIDACPAGHQPTSCSRDAETTTTRVEMPASACVGCPFRKLCPIEDTQDGKFTLEFTDKERRLAGRRVEETTDVFGERYAPRSGIESTNSGLKNRLGLGSLSVRGREERIACASAQAGGLERAAGDSVAETEDLGRLAGVRDARERRSWAIRRPFWSRGTPCWPSGACFLAGRTAGPAYRGSCQRLDPRSGASCRGSSVGDVKPLQGGLVLKWPSWSSSSRPAPPASAPLPSRWVSPVRHSSTG